MDFFQVIVDTLAQRYGWGYKEISDEMYWEEVYELYEYASNCNVLEKNEDMRFNFLLHAGSKEAINSWQDLLIPFPDRNWKPKAPKNLVILPQKFNSKKNTSKMSAEQQERAEYVRKRIQESKEKAERELNAYYGN